jgi:dienelactone hydrolase
VAGAADAVLRPRPPAAEGCGPGWAEAALRAQRRPAHPVGDTRRRMQAGEFAGRLYVLHVPEDYRGDEPFPLLIVLGGGPGRALPAAHNHREAVEPTGYLAVYPHAHGAWWDEATGAAVRALLYEVLGLLNVDVNRVYLTGPSNGGTGTFLYASRWPDRLAAAATLMGANAVFFEGMEAPPLLGNLRHLPLLFLHGEKDKVIPPFATRDSVKAIRRRNPEAPIEEVILPGRGHDLNLRTDGGRTLAFFARHVRDPFPRRVVLETREAGARSHWVEVTAKNGAVASVEGEIRDDNTITLATKRVKQVRLRLRRELLPAAGPATVLIDGREAWRGDVADDCDLLRRSADETRDPFLAHGWERAFDVPR